jgi:hypothetical protein
VPLWDAHQALERACGGIVIREEGRDVAVEHVNHDMAPGDHLELIPVALLDPIAQGFVRVERGHLTSDGSRRRAG